MWQSTGRNTAESQCRAWLASLVNWRAEALEWQRDPAGPRGFLALIERYLAEGPPGHRMTREEFRAQRGA